MTRPDMNRNPEYQSRKVRDALEKIAVACTGKLKKDLLAGAVPIPANKAMTISRMAPPMRRAQARSYAETGKALKLPLYKHVLDAALATVANNGKDKTVVDGSDIGDALASVLNARSQISASAGEVVPVPPLDTEKFSELINRVDRALGLVSKVAVDMPRLHGVDPTADERSRLRERLSQIIRYAGLIGGMLDGLPHAGITTSTRRKIKRRAGKSDR